MNLDCHLVQLMACQVYGLHQLIEGLLALESLVLGTTLLLECHDVVLLKVLTGHYLFELHTLPKIFSFLLGNLVVRLLDILTHWVSGRVKSGYQ